MVNQYQTYVFPDFVPASIIEDLKNITEIKISTDALIEQKSLTIIDIHI
jgi:hypothetical protein